jgi:hypothetical protein
VKHLILMLSRDNDFKFFKTSFISLIDKILILDEKDLMIKSVYSLVSKFFNELSKQGDKLNQSK